MRFIKTAKDAEGAVAEAIGVELTFAADISHPTTDLKEISIDGCFVSLPTLNLDTNLAVLLYDGNISTEQKFLDSLGGVIAFYNDPNNLDHKILKI